MIAVSPELAYDSYVTIGLDGPAMELGDVNAGIIPGPWSADFEAGGPVIVDDLLGGGWYVVPDANNAVVGADARILIAQLTTDGQISGSFRAQVFPNGNYENDDRVDITFLDAICGCNDPTALNFDPEANFLLEGSCIMPILGCVDDMACNYDAEANTDDGSCEYAAEGYDCDGVCLEDTDGDGVCDQFELAGCQDEMACNYDATCNRCRQLLVNMQSMDTIVMATAWLMRMATAYAINLRSEAARMNLRATSMKLQPMRMEAAYTQKNCTIAMATA